MWHRVAPALAGRFTLIIPDLPGYGASAAPESNADHAPYDKRSMAKALVELMAAFGHDRFSLAGHDRGGRVAYRLALDHAARVARLATLDIIPTGEMWRTMDMTMAMKTYHWLFLAQRAPLPEQMIGHMPVAYLEWTLASWTKAKNLSAFAPDAMTHYRAAYAGPHIHALCEDYRAGATTDLVHDNADRAAGRTIDCPMLALWGDAGIPDETSAPLATWQRWATNVQGRAIDSGHFLAEENPNETAKALLEFFTA
jgi:haloacetate dehalogenase